LLAFSGLGRSVETQLRSLGIDIRAETVMTSAGPEILVLPEKRWRNMIMRNKPPQYRLKNTKVSG
jgi:hypothetical protein